MVYTFEFIEPPSEVTQTANFTSINLQGAWNLFLAAHPDYTSVESVIDSDGDIHPTDPPGSNQN